MNFKKLILSIMFVTIYLLLSAQDEPPAYWIGFTDKLNNDYSIDFPEDFLSQRALDRRSNQGIEIDSTDLPVSSFYTDSLTSLGLSLRYTSKWLNGAVVLTHDTDLIDTIESYGFVRNSEFIRMAVITKSSQEDNFFDYGFANNQITMLNGHILHNQGYRGEGMMIAVLDGGFYDMTGLSSFQYIFSENRILATEDFVDMDNQVFSHSSHGKSVMSILAGEDEGQLVGAAPRAEFLLIRTEDGATEQRIEEYNWARGAEFADSMGVDVINVSLGYREFDLEQWNYSTADTDGQTAPISRAASLAGQKGILVSISAGNNGNDPNPYIGMPADADSVITVGATDSLGHYSALSSIGYSADGRVKPNVVAQGQDTYYQTNSNSISQGSGTSFSSPLIAGMAACLWQANPQMSNMEIINAIEQSANYYDTPTDTMGYGIPDFGAANLILKKIQYNDFQSEQLVKLYPNPTANDLTIDFYSVDTQEVKLNVYSSRGRLIISKDMAVKRSSYNRFPLPEIAALSRGMYILHLQTETRRYSEKFVKH